MVFHRRFRKYAKKQLNRGKRFAKKRYVRKSGGLKLGTIVRDVAMLKKVINSETKHYEQKIVNYRLAQWNATQSGHQFFTITALPSVGILGEQQRVGNSIKMKSLQLTAQITKGAGIMGSVRYKIHFFRLSHNTSTASLSSIDITDLFDKNEFNNTTYDFVSTRNSDKYGQFKSIGTISGFFKQSASVTQPGDVNQLHTKKFNRMCDWHTEFQKGNTTNVTKNQIYCIMLCDNYNKANANEYLNVNMNYKWNYYDN